ncbi:MAG: hypothetical protein ABUS47_15365 [Steroidobacter sp.]
MTSEVKALSERQRYWLEHLRAAEVQRVSLAAYAQEQGLGLKQLYGAKVWLKKLGHWPGETDRSLSSTTRSTSTSSSGARSSHCAAGISHSGFVAVRLPATSSSTQPSVCCVLRHISGWRVECDALPSTEWLNALVRDAVHASA